jgi:hypothetical protein
MTLPVQTGNGGLRLNPPDGPWTPLPYDPSVVRIERLDPLDGDSANRRSDSGVADQ